MRFRTQRNAPGRSQGRCTGYRRCRSHKHSRGRDHRSTRRCSRSFRLRVARRSASVHRNPRLEACRRGGSWRRRPERPAPPRRTARPPGQRAPARARRSVGRAHRRGRSSHGSRHGRNPPGRLAMPPLRCSSGTAAPSVNPGLLGFLNRRCTQRPARSLRAHVKLEASFHPPRYKLAMGRAAPKTASALLPSSAAQARVFDRSWALASGLGGFGLDVGV